MVSSFSTSPGRKRKWGGGCSIRINRPGGCFPLTFFRERSGIPFTFRPPSSYSREERRGARLRQTFFCTPEFLYPTFCFCTATYKAKGKQEIVGERGCTEF